MGGVGWISCSGSRPTLLTELRVAGDVGHDRPSQGDAIIATRISGAVGDLRIDGSLLGSIQSTGQGSGSTFYSLGPLIIGGDLVGGVSLGTNSSIDYLDVGGTIGPASGTVPVAISVPGNIYFLSGSSIHADISAGNIVHRSETTAGDFRGSLTAARLLPLSPGPIIETAEFRISGDLNASVTLSGDVTVPVFVGGDVPAMRVVDGENVANELSFGDEFFEVAGTGTETMTVNGDFNGSLTLGVPNAAGVMSALNRNLIINGTLEGAIAADTAINANIVVNGGVSATGRIDVSGAVPSGRSITVSGGPMAGTIAIAGSLQGSVVAPTNGLEGQVIVNRDDNGGAWTGAVQVGTIRLEPSSQTHRSERGSNCDP